MKIVWYSNAPWVPSGYGVQTGLICKRLQALGHEVFCITNVGLMGATIKHQGVPVFPCSDIGRSDELLYGQIRELAPECVITFMDPWALNPKVFGSRWCPWFPVDREPMSDMTFDSVKDTLWPITCSRSGFSEMVNRGREAGYVPCAVDTKVFSPIPQAEARATIGVNPDVFLVGIVADNKGWPSRKALPQQIEAFAEFHKKVPNSQLYLHTCLTPARGGFDVVGFVHSLGLDIGMDKAVVAVDQPRYLHGLPQDFMRTMYSCMDVLMGVSMDEGFGVPLVEAQACGTPVITGGWTAMPELAGPGWSVSKRDAQKVLHQCGGYQYSPDIEAIVNCLHEAHAAKGDMDIRNEAREFALGYDVDFVVEEYWKLAIQQIQERIVAAPRFEEALRS